MKIWPNDVIIVYFINNNMITDIHKERTKLTQIINDENFNCMEFVKTNKIINNNSPINFLCQVLMLTIKYPQVELYLKNLLNNFTINELENIYCGWTILHIMVLYPLKISLNAFEIIINYGVNVNIKSPNSNTPTNLLLRSQCTDHICNILNLLIKYDADLNIVDHNIRTILDVLSENQKQLNQETKNCVMLLVDFGARTNISNQNNKICDFIEHYKSSIIKPAIKNENKI